MRVIAGKFKGHIIKAPRGAAIRPSSQKLKEALFNILGEGICNASFLELFAGSGNIGIEALSRGAKKVFFVENNRNCIKAIEVNLSQLKVSYDYGFKRREETARKVGARLFFLEAEKAIKLLAQKKEKLDFIFLDPPYYRDEALRNCLIKICLYDILRPRAYVIVEHNKRQALPNLLSGLKLMLSKSYGDSALSFYQMRLQLKER